MHGSNSVLGDVFESKHSIMWQASLNLVPRDGANGTEVFTKLAANFNLSDTDERSPHCYENGQLG